MSLFNFRNNYKTARPQRRQHPAGSKGERLQGYIARTLGKGNVYDAVVLPPGEVEDEWIAVNTIDFYNAISLLYSTLADFCTRQTCPKMIASTKYEYLWADSQAYKKPLALPAPDYVSNLFTWVEGLLDDPAIFPSLDSEKPFPPNFRATVSLIYKRLFRVYAHMYHHHSTEVDQMHELQHLNTCFKHFMFFVLHFNLLDSKDTAPMAEVIDKFKAQMHSRSQGEQLWEGLRQYQA